MARMHSRKRGKAGSKKPPREKEQPWLSYTSEEVEQLVVKLAKAEHAPSKIGMVLRDEYGIPDVKKITGKKVLDILRNAKQATGLPEGLTALMRNQAFDKVLSERGRVAEGLEGGYCAGEVDCGMRMLFSGFLETFIKRGLFEC